MPVRLSVHFPNAPVRSFVLKEGEAYLVGREEDCQVVVDDPAVSRHHARFDGTGESWTVEDLGSKNGLSVDGEAVSRSTLESDAWVGLGGLMVRFEVVSGEVLQEQDTAFQRRWRTSLEMQARIDPSQGLQELLHQVLGSIVEVAGGERGFVLLTREDGELELSAVQGLEAGDLSASSFSGSSGAVERTLETGEPVTLSDAQADLALGKRYSVLAGGVRALICLPLKAVDRVIGVVYADSRTIGKAFTELDVEILSALASHAALAIAVARMHEEVEAMGRELPPSAGLAAAWERSLPSYRPHHRSVGGETLLERIGSGRRKAAGAPVS